MASCNTLYTKWVNDNSLNGLELEKNINFIKAISHTNKVMNNKLSNLTNLNIGIIDNLVNDISLLIKDSRTIDCKNKLNQYDYFLMQKGFTIVDFISYLSAFNTLSKNLFNSITNIIKQQHEILFKIKKIEDRSIHIPFEHEQAIKSAKHISSTFMKELFSLIQQRDIFKPVYNDIKDIPELITF